MAQRRRIPARSVMDEHEDTIRQILGDRDYRLLVRYLLGSHRLIQKLEAAIPARRRQIKMSPELDERTRIALEALAEQLAGVAPTLIDTQPEHTRRPTLKVVARKERS